MRYYQIVKKLDDSKFVYIKRHWGVQKKLNTIHQNMWSMFDMEAAKILHKKDGDVFLRALDEEDVRMSVSDFAWTEEVREAFYKHSANRPIHKRDITWLIFNEPEIYNKGKKGKNERKLNVSS